MSGEINYKETTPFSEDKDVRKAWEARADANSQTRVIRPGEVIRTPDELRAKYSGPVATTPPVAGTKYDGGKPRMDLLDANFLEKVAQVLTFGAEKYAAHNWRSGISYSRLIAATYRHLGAINRGEDIDPESGKPHVGHLGCCIMFLSGMMDTKPELDDRWKN